MLKMYGLDTSGSPNNNNCVLIVEESPEGSKKFRHVEGTRERIGKFFDNYFYVDCSFVSFKEWAKALEAETITIADFVQLVDAKT